MSPIVATFFKKIICNFFLKHYYIMSFIFGSPIKTKQLFLENSENSGEIYTLQNDLYFKNSNNIEYKLNHGCISSVNNNIGICTDTPGATLDVFSQNTHLKLSYSDTIWSKLKISSSQILDISGQLSININDSQLTNVKYPVEETDGANKKYVDDKLGCNSVNILSELCSIYNFIPSSTTTDAEITEQITLRNQFKIPLLSTMVAVSAEYHPICVKDGVLTFRIPFNIFITEIRAALTKPAVGCSGIKFNINQTESQCDLLESDFYIPPGHKCVTLNYSPTNQIFKVNQLVDNEELVINIKQVGDIFAGSGLKITIIGI